MTAHFKVSAGRTAIYPVTREQVEDRLGRRAPWFRPGPLRGDDKHFAVCPYCDNAIQLKGVYHRHERSPRAYGSHVGTPVEGFAYDLTDLEHCPFRLSRKSHGKSDRRAMGPVARQLIDLAVSEFDRIVLILRDDFGFRFSDAFAERMLDQWFDSRGFCYTGAHLRNLPWMIAYFGPTQKLFGQPIGQNDELANHIRECVPRAKILETGRLDKGVWIELYVQCLHHRMEVKIDTGELRESMKLRVQDLTSSNDATVAPTIYQNEIIFDAERFERLIHTPKERARRDEGLLERAQKIGAKWLL
ncbi:hypothetical protein [Paraburkholderia tagetis]|uniref:Uncharacterized protein n=1 Tax=Paraburkholderia tagetis TaxID=2913261 RepID=A0A9X1RVY1_9BURK|nr:hypothetical protein [Paraburkholderia tagetis]MCG5077106.1 hypothetical protein [Paraburkholderia tagetis]